MESRFRDLREKQLIRALEPFMAARETPRPLKGWLRAIREVSGLTLSEVATRMGASSPQLVFHLEKSEADHRITLKRLRAVADALGFQLIYALVPKHGTLEDAVLSNARTKAGEGVRTVEHSMALEDQAVGNVTEKIEEETRRLLKRG